MKIKIILTVLLNIFLLYFLSAEPAFSQDTSELRPTQPPRIPVTDFGDGPHRIFDFLYMHYSFEEFTLDGGGAGFNYVNNYNNMAYNVGAGIIYMQGSSSDLDPQLNVYDTNLPINGNIGYRLAGTQDTSNLMVFGGFSWMYTWIVVNFGEDDAYAYGPAYGPLFGVKAEIKLTPSVSIIPYYIFQYTNFDLTVEVNGVAQDVSIDPVTSNLLGFDIKIGAISVGALLDTLNNTDNNKITIMFSYDFDYKTGSEDLNRGDSNDTDKTENTGQKREKTKKPKKQTNIQ